VAEQPRCPDHTREIRREADQRRGSASERGYGERWRRTALGFLRKHPLCHYCNLQGRVTRATQVDHSTPRTRDPDLFWERSNWRPACAPCNAAKGTRTEAEYLAALGVHCG
jgi:5-methylcytosine-specific restriction enzyme A